MVYIMLRLSGDPKKWLSYMAEKSDRTFDQLCFDLALQPMKMIVYNMYSIQGLFVRNAENVVACLNMLNYEMYIFYVYLNCFNCVQLCAEHCSDKEKFMRNVATLFGVYSEQESAKEVDTKTNFLFFALCLALNRCSYDMKTYEVNTVSVNTIIKCRDVLVEEIKNFISLMNHHIH